MPFHGNIALPIETEINAILNNNCYKVTADEIETGGFITTLCFILFIMQKNSDGVIAFQRNYAKFIGMTYTEIGETQCENIFLDFKKLLMNND